MLFLPGVSFLSYAAVISTVDQRDPEPVSAARLAIHHELRTAENISSPNSRP
jgi:hypothetical protein